MHAPPVWLLFLAVLLCETALGTSAVLRPGDVPPACQVICSPIVLLSGACNLDKNTTGPSPPTASQGAPLGPGAPATPTILNIPTPTPTLAPAAPPPAAQQSQPPQQQPQQAPPGVQAPQVSAAPAVVPNVLPPAAVTPTPDTGTPPNPKPPPPPPNQILPVPPPPPTGQPPLIQPPPSGQPPPLPLPLPQPPVGDKPPPPPPQAQARTPPDVAPQATPIVNRRRPAAAGAESRLPPGPMPKEAAEHYCLCENQSFNVASISGLCGSCISQNTGASGGVLTEPIAEGASAPNPMDPVMRECHFPPTTYSSANDSAAAGLTVIAQVPVPMATGLAVAGNGGRRTSGAARNLVVETRGWTCIPWVWAGLTSGVLILGW